MKLSNAYRSRKPKAQITIKLRHFKKGVTDGEIILHYKTKYYLSCFWKSESVKLNEF